MQPVKFSIKIFQTTWTLNIDYIRLKVFLKSKSEMDNRFIPESFQNEFDENDLILYDPEPSDPIADLHDEEIFLRFGSANMDIDVNNYDELISYEPETIEEEEPDQDSGDAG